MHDALVGDGVLALVPAGAELIDVGKRPGRPVPQDADLGAARRSAGDGQARRAAEGRRPVRVRSRRRGGAGAARGRRRRSRSCPASRRRVARRLAAGIPVTHRGVSAAFTVVTGHRRAGEPDVDWRSLAKVGGTIVMLMGVAQRATIAAELIAGGLDPSTPVAADPLARPPTSRRSRAARSVNSATHRSIHHRHRRRGGGGVRLALDPRSRDPTRSAPPLIRYPTPLPADELDDAVAIRRPSKTRGGVGRSNLAAMENTIAEATIDVIDNDADAVVNARHDGRPGRGRAAGRGDLDRRDVRRLLTCRHRSDRPVCSTGSWTLHPQVAPAARAVRRARLSLRQPQAGVPQTPRRRAPSPAARTSTRRSPPRCRPAMSTSAAGRRSSALRLPHRIADRPRAPLQALVEQLKGGLDAPICLTWELTYACNLECVHCLSSSMNEGST